MMSPFCRRTKRRASATCTSTRRRSSSRPIPRYNVLPSIFCMQFVCNGFVASATEWSCRVEYAAGAVVPMPATICARPATMLCSEALNRRPVSASRPPMEEAPARAPFAGAFFAASCRELSVNSVDRVRLCSVIHLQPRHARRAALSALPGPEKNRKNDHPNDALAGVPRCAARS